MGIASYDVTGDGYPDYFLTSMADNKLQTFTSAPASGPPRPDYKDVAFAKGVTAQRPYTGGDVRPSTAWHAQFEDVNNDGLVDLFIAKGNVSEMPDFAANDPNNLLLQDGDGKFNEVGDKAGIASMAGAARRGAAGFQPRRPAGPRRRQPRANRHSSGATPRRTPATGSSCACGRTAPNRDAIGAWLEVRCGEMVVRREITVGGGHASGQSGWWHFGLGESPEAEVRVIWPDGTTSDWQRVDGNNFYILERDKAAEVWPKK